MAVDSKWFPNGNTDTQSHFSADAEHLWLPGGPASGDIPDEIGSEDLAPAGFGSPIYQQDFTGEGADDPDGVEFDDETSDGFDASIASWSDESWLLLIPWKATENLGDNYLSVCGRFTSGWRGWKCEIKTDYSSGYFFLTGYFRGETTTSGFTLETTTTGDGDTDPHFVAVWHHAGDNEQGLYTDMGDITDTVDVGTLSHVANLTIGDEPEAGLGSAPLVMGGGIALFRGSEAEGIIDDLSQLDDWWASEDSAGSVGAAAGTSTAAAVAGFVGSAAGTSGATAVGTSTAVSLGTAISFPDPLLRTQDDVVGFFGAPASEVYDMTTAGVSHHDVDGIEGGVLTATGTTGPRTGVAVRDPSLGGRVEWDIYSWLVETLDGGLYNPGIVGWDNTWAEGTERIYSGALGNGGAMEWELDTGYYCIFGLGAPPFTPINRYEVRFGFYHYRDTNNLYIYHGNGVDSSTTYGLGVYPPGTRVRIQVTKNGTVNYYVNNIWRYTSTTAAPDTLAPCVMLYQTSVMRPAYLASFDKEEPTGVYHAYATTEGHDAPNDTVNEFDDVPFAAIVPWRWVDTGSTTFRSVFGKRELPSPYAGYEFLISATQAEIVVDDGPGSSTAVISWDGDTDEPHWAGFYNSVDLAEVALITEYGSDTGTRRDVPSAAIFTLGHQRTTPAPAIKGPAIPVWSGANAEIAATNFEAKIEKWWEQLIHGSVTAVGTSVARAVGGPTWQRATWTNIFGIAEHVNGNLHRNNSTGWNAGCTSVEQIKSGTQGNGGSFEWETSGKHVAGVDTPAGSQFVGLSPPPDLDHTGVENPFSIYHMYSSGNVYIFESGASVLGHGFEPANTKFKINVAKDGEVTYYVDGVLIYTSLVAAPEVLEVDVVIYVGRTAILNPKLTINPFTAVDGRAPVRAVGYSISASKWPKNQAGVVARFGADAEELYLPGKLASGSIVGEIAANVLTEVSSPDRQQVLTGDPDDPLSAGFDNGTSDGFIAASSAVHDYDNVAFAVLTTVKISASGSTRCIYNKRDPSASNYGWNLLVLTDGQLMCVFHGLSGKVDQWTGIISYDTLLYVFQFYSVASSLVGMTSSAAAELSESSSGCGSVTSPRVFALGNGMYPAPDMVMGPTIVWSGANAEAIIANRDVVLPAWWALDGGYTLGVGASVATAVGAAAGTSTAAAVGEGATNSVGDSIGTSTVLAVGESDADAAGACAGTGTALGLGTSVATAVGASRPSASKWLDRGQTDVVDLFGAACDDVYRAGEDASGGITGKVASNVLSPIASPDYQQILTGIPGDPRGVGFDDASADSFDAAFSTVHDFTTQAFAALGFFRVTDLFAAVGQKQIFGKRAGLSGFTLRTSSSKISYLVAGDITYKTISVGASPNVGDLMYGMVWRNGISTGLDSSAGNITDDLDVGSITNAALFSLGQGHNDAAGIVLGGTIVWSGAEAETVIANRATTLPAWWSLPETSTRGTSASTAAATGLAEGTSTATAVAPILAVGAAAGVGTATAVGVSEATAVGAAAGTSAVYALGSSEWAVIALAGGTTTVLGVGAATAVAVGASAGAAVATAVSVSGAAGASVGVATAAAVGASVAESAGASAGIGAATAVSISGAVGASVGVSAAAAVGVSVAESAGASAGTAVATAVSVSGAAGVSAGIAVAAAAGASVAESAGASAGVAIAAAVGTTAGSVTGVGAAAGVATSAAVGASVAAAVGADAGTATATAVGVGATSSIGASVGAGTATAVGEALVRSEGAAAGSSTVYALGSAEWAVVAISGGTTTALGVGVSTAEAVGVDAGTAVGAAVGAATAEGVGASAGSATVLGVGNAVLLGAGASAGTSTSAAVGASATTSTGASVGVGTATAVGTSTAVAVGAAAGTGTATAVGVGSNSGAGVSAGASTVTATSIEYHRAIGGAAGTSTVVATGFSTASSVGDSTGVALATAVTTTTATVVGISAGTCTSTAVGVSTALGAGEIECVATATALAPAFDAFDVYLILSIPTGLQCEDLDAVVVPRNFQVADQDPAPGIPFGFIVETS